MGRFKLHQYCRQFLRNRIMQFTRQAIALRQRCCQASLLIQPSQFITLETGKLIKKGLIDKRPHEIDRRSVSLSLTKQGQVLLREVWPLRRRTNDLTFQSLTRERAAILDEIVGTLVMGARMALHELEAPQRSGQKAPSIEAKPKNHLADPCK